MTICKVLAEKTSGDYEITAYENHDKDSRLPRYEIVKSKDGFCVEYVRAARTTWKKRFNEMQ